MYQFSSNNFPSIYFLWYLQDPAFKWDQCIFEARCFFYNCLLNVLWTYNLSLIAVLLHVCGLWVLPPGDFRHGSNGFDLHLWEHFLGSDWLDFVHLMLQKTIARWTSSRIRLTDWSLDEWQTNYSKQISEEATHLNATPTIGICLSPGIY